MAVEPERTCFVTRGVKKAIWQVRLRAPFSSARLTHFTSPRDETCRPVVRPNQNAGRCADTCRDNIFLLNNGEQW